MYDNTTGARYGATERSKALRRVLRALKARGWEPLDFGSQPCFVQALLVSPCGTRVVKIASTAPKPDTGNTDRWPSFARWVWSQRTQSPHLPRFYSFHEFGGLVIVCMERLYDVGSSRISESRRAERISEQADVLQDEVYYAEDWPTWKRRFPVAFRHAVASMTDALGFPTDLHRGNVMVRTGPRGGNPTLVLTDPYGHY